MMRRILVDAARARGSGKRDGGVVKVNVNDVPVLSPEGDASIPLGSHVNLTRNALPVLDPAKRQSSGPHDEYPTFQSHPANSDQMKRLRK
jgi:hypothetical protein